MQFENQSLARDIREQVREEYTDLVHDLFGAAFDIKQKFDTFRLASRWRCFTFCLVALKPLWKSLRVLQEHCLLSIIINTSKASFSCARSIVLILFSSLSCPLSLVLILLSLFSCPYSLVLILLSLFSCPYSLVLILLSLFSYPHSLVLILLSLFSCPYSLVLILLSSIT